MIDSTNITFEFGTKIRRANVAHQTAADIVNNRNYNSMPTAACTDFEAALLEAFNITFNTSYIKVTKTGMLPQLNSYTLCCDGIYILSSSDENADTAVHIQVAIGRIRSLSL